MRCGDLYAEAVYKEGAHAEVSADWLDGALSGAPAAPGADGIVVVRERFVLDLNAFGPDGNCITPTQYARLCRKAHWLDEQGHLVMDAEYDPAEAELEDIDFYAEYLLREHRDGLLAFCFSEEPTDTELREALLRSFESVRAIALRSPELRSWRDKYFVSRAGYEERLEDDGPLGGGDLNTLFHGLARAGRDGCAYSAVGPRIIDLLSHGGLDPDEEVLIRGCDYATAVCHANLSVADALRRRQRDGVLASGVHLRLDDDWQSGGIWRAETVTDPARYSLATVPPTIPLALGHAETLPDVPAVETFSADEVPLDSSGNGCKVVLTARDRLCERLRLTPKIRALLPASGPIEVVIAHDGEREAVLVNDLDDTTLFGIPWPLALHPGIVLYCYIEREGSVVRVRTVKLTRPLFASNGDELQFETNVAVYEQAAGIGELSPKDKRSAPSLAELINRAFRRYGLERNDGSRALTLGGIATSVLGPAWLPGDTRALAAALQEMGLERDGAFYIWQPRVSHRTRAADRSLLTAYGEGQPPDRLARIVHRHWVPMHLRRLADWQDDASVSKHGTYEEERIKNGMHGVLPDTLPPGYTWVIPHARGGEHEEPEGEQLELDLALVDEAVAAADAATVALAE
jgi:hypothetical protein